jgi:hypothetical protein
MKFYSKHLIEYLKTVRQVGRWVSWPCSEKKKSSNQFDVMKRKLRGLVASQKVINHNVTND